jgi:hypothetical protein
MIYKLTLTLFIALSLAITACAPTTGIATPSVPPSLPPAATQPAATFVPALPPPFPQTQSVDGLEVELLNARILDGQLTIDICHQMPTQEDWIVGGRPEDVFVTIDGETTNLNGFGILYYRTSYKGGNSHRCDALTFPVSNPNPGKMTLTINEFYTSVPEAPDCEAAQKKLDEAKTGIKIGACESIAYDSGGGSFNYDITQKPEGMSEDDARMIVFDSFSSHAKGPWVFEINMPTPLVVTTSTPWPTPAGIEPINGEMATVNGVDMLVTGNFVDGALFQADVCYTPPSKDSAWALAQSPQDITLEVAGQVYPVDNITYTGWENDYGFPHISERYRCHRLSFTIPAEADTSLVTLRLNTLYEFPAESGCDQKDITFESGRITNAACSTPLSEIAGPWEIQTGLPHQ